MSMPQLKVNAELLSKRRVPHRLEGMLRRLGCRLSEGQLKEEVAQSSLECSPLFCCCLSLS